MVVCECGSSPAVYRTAGADVTVNPHSRPQCRSTLRVYMRVCRQLLRLFAASEEIGDSFRPHECVPVCDVVNVGERHFCLDAPQAVPYCVV